ncbi:M6 family metalloprotease domain-containing protein [Prosthecobacter sp. SYSU 5D2]|uniref:M6 family metalloprotease domain-containing protein n=1 Tax=Prosthecobacter sp. SYSU 5D2 TaxID=3134134 RepID=UPI0031FF2835
MLSLALITASALFAEAPAGTPPSIAGHFTVSGAQVSTRPNPVPPRHVFGADRDWQKQPLRVATLLIEFADQKHQAVHSAAFYEKMLFSRDEYHQQPDGKPSFGSLADWYRIQSNGRFVLTGKVFDWLSVDNTFQAIHDMEFKAAKKSLFQTALDLLREREGAHALDGYDVFAFIHAGPITGPSSNILWSHASTIESKRYFTTGEIERIGVFCHEWGHILGVPDLYAKKDVRESFGPWCSMAGGYRGIYPRSFCVWTKTRLGWCDPTIVDAGTPQKLVLRPIQDHPNDAFIIPLNSLDGVGAEFLMLENRSTAGNDAEGQAGLFIWRIKRLLSTSDLPRYELKLPGPADVPGIDLNKRWVAWPNGTIKDFILPGEGRNFPVNLRNIRLVNGLLYFDLSLQ